MDGGRSVPVFTERLALTCTLLHGAAKTPLVGRWALSAMMLLHQILVFTQPDIALFSIKSWLGRQDSSFTTCRLFTYTASYPKFVTLALPPQRRACYSTPGIVSVSEVERGSNRQACTSYVTAFRLGTGTSPLSGRYGG